MKCGGAGGDCHRPLAQPALPLTARGLAHMDMDALARMAKLICALSTKSHPLAALRAKGLHIKSVPLWQEGHKEEICLNWTQARGISTGNFGVIGTQNVV